MILSWSVHTFDLRLEYLNKYKMEAMKSCTDIHSLPRMNPTDFGDPFALHVAPSLAQNFNLSNTLV